MQHSNRRRFLQQAGVLSAAAATFAAPAYARSMKSNYKITMGIIGCGGQGSNLLRVFNKIADVSYVCDPDESHCGNAKESSGAKHAVTDFRRVLDDPSVDAVVVATPDHWHAPAAIMACEAGKHVYVEKPCSHNYVESKLLVEAARRNNVVVQHGTQSRSNVMIANAVQMLREGVIGDVLMAKAWNVQTRPNIGRMTPSDPPSGVDYDTWVGPAEFMPYQENRFHYNWHWWYNFGTGDIGNDGTHEIDYARWGLGVEGLPATVTGLGGKYFHDDDQQYPDTATCAFEWPGDGSVGKRRQLIFEMRLWSTNYPYNCDSGAEFYGTEGRLFMSKRGKLEIYGPRNARIEDAEPAEPVLFESDHRRNFIDSIIAGTRPRADIAIAHDSVSLVHLANIAARLGRSLHVDAQQEIITGDEEATRLLTRNYREGGHWAVPKGAQV
jgi:predicted dehydrogenase